ncbi:hypothetical protein [Fructilactobacillus fructivorans]|uniref:hypothetical protein n=1 Tax=Fructilactobacillus fructivorans TaxID=1614 RepID=UPI0012E8C1A9|nr:hypothetical protein [Fructilactobacillus fructivorans]
MKSNKNNKKSKVIEKIKVYKDGFSKNSRAINGIKDLNTVVSGLLIEVYKLLKITISEEFAQNAMHNMVDEIYKQDVGKNKKRR